MFSVRSSPFNSRARSLYGGWALSGNVAGSTAAQLAAIYANNPGQAAKDQKWASLARKYSTTPADLDSAALIKSVLTRQNIHDWRQDPVWRDRYSQALRHMRSPYMKQPFSAQRRQAIWSRFRNIPWENITAADRAWIQAATNAPYAGVPSLTGVADAANFSTGNTVARLGYRRPAAIAEDIAWQLPAAAGGPAAALDFMNPLQAAQQAAQQAGQAAAAAAAAAQQAGQAAQQVGDMVDEAGGGGN